ncbi:SDR family oxidoreductase [Penaeicola halotolerans]|uniref:SDR family oxidoreductase n=1 Tax=Penaeicola halotolerans TaxID=2793196 RepID=UPI001CF8B3A5|nr:NAD(P)-dependent oxidoreductase [Penaeicola halotolerans]
MSKSKRVVLVTGANGLLGQKLLVQLSNDPSIELHATGRGVRRLKDQGAYTYHVADLSLAADVDRMIDQIQPDSIIHGAAMTNVDQCETDREGCYAANVTAVKNLLEAAAKYQSYFLLVSTDFIFDGFDGPYDESAEANPLSYYGESKLLAEQLVQAYTGSWGIARTVLVYGIAEDLSRSNIVLWVKKSLEEGKPIQVVDDQWRTPTLAEDLATGCLLMEETLATGIYNISGKELMTPYEIALQIADFFKLDIKLIQRVDGSIFTQTAKRPAKTGFIIKKAQEKLGFQPHTFVEGVAILAKQLNLA